MIRVLKYLFLFVLISYGCLYYLGSGRIGEDLVSGPVASDPVPPEQLERRDLAQRAATDRAQPAATRQILFGDLHVHSTISTDAFQASMSMYGGNGANPVSDACDFARYCSALDFWSINDHAISITPKRWRETKNAIESCNAVAGAGDNPDMVAFLGWEWTQIGTDPSNHYGHKNVILKSGDMNKAPIRPISAGYPPGTDSISSIPTAALGLLPFVLGFGADTHNYITYLQETLSTSDCPPNPGVMDCRQVARTPDALFSQLDEWGGDAMVIPHGSTWGFYTPPGSSWEKQLNSQQHDPKRQKLVEVFSGHGNSEEYRSWREVSWDAEGNPVCPEASDNYLPSCQRAGDIIQQRCLDGGAQSADCAQRAAEARLNYVAAGTEGFLTVPGAKPADWLDAGQCSDCFLPAFNYRPLSSVQYMMALSDFDADSAEPQRFRFGFMGSSDNHSARPGTGYKEFSRDAMTESRFANFVKNPLDRKIEMAVQPRSIPFDREDYPMGFASLKEMERSGSFFMTGGLIAVHAESRSREDIWAAMDRKEVYGTSGPRILLWFNLLNPQTEGKLGMGGETRMKQLPEFEVGAVGSFEQLPGCPQSSEASLGRNRIQDLCRGGCYHPADKRRAISRIEVVRIQPQVVAGEPIAPLIQDPWKVIPCDGDPAGCTARFTDEDFTLAARDTLYYVRAIEAPSLAVGAGGVRCESDAAGNCDRVNLCNIDDPADDCLAENEERAWSSPIFVDYGEPE